MGGMGFIEHNKALCMLSVLINTHMLQAARKYKVGRFFYSSSACVYNGDMQKAFEAPSLKEADAYPASRKMAMGWEKLFLSACVATSGKILVCIRALHGFITSTGPGYVVRRAGEGSAAICRKVIEAKVSGKHEIDTGAGKSDPQLHVH